MKSFVLSALVLTLLTACASPYEPKTMTFSTADHQQVALKFNPETGIPLASGDEQMTVVNASMVLIPQPTNPQIPMFGWAFAIKFDAASRPTRIVVSDVGRSQVEDLVIDDKPRLEEGVWQGSSNAEPQSPDFFKGMATNKQAWWLLFRMVVDYDDGSQSVVYQGALYPQSTRIALIDGFLSRNKK